MHTQMYFRKKTKHAIVLHDLELDILCSYGNVSLMFRNSIYVEINKYKCYLRGHIKAE